VSSTLCAQGKKISPVRSVTGAALPCLRSSRASRHRWSERGRKKAPPSNNGQGLTSGCLGAGGYLTSLLTITDMTLSIPVVEILAGKNGRYKREPSR
jgi:hypothetical protein